MMSSEKNSAGPTSFDDSTTTCQRSAVRERRRVERSAAVAGIAPCFAATARSRCLCMFSIITIAASIIAPIAMAMPPSDMMSAPTPTMRMAMNAMRMPTGSVRIATSAELRVQQEHDAHERDDDRLLDAACLAGSRSRAR